MSATVSTTVGWVVRLVWLVLLGIATWDVAWEGPARIRILIAWLLLAASVAVVFAAAPRLRRASPTGPGVVQAVFALTAGAVAFFLTLALLWHFIGTPTPPAPIADVTDSTKFDSLLNYAKGITYEATAHGMADSAMLTDTVGGAYPPVKAWIAPARGANFVFYRDLTGSGLGKGRVVARVTVDTTGGGAGYRLLNLPAGVSYIWVDNLARHDTTGTFRALIIPDRPGGKIMFFPKKATFVFLRNYEAFANHPEARWVFQHSQCTNPGCASGCCRVCPG